MFGRDCCDLGTAWLPRRRGLTGDHLSPGGSTGEMHVPDAAHSAPVCNSLPFQLHVALGLRVTALGERGAHSWVTSWLAWWADARPGRSDVCCGWKFAIVIASRDVWTPNRGSHLNPHDHKNTSKTLLKTPPPFRSLPWIASG